MQSFGIKDLTYVKTIKGTILTKDAKAIHKLSFGTKDGAEIAKVELCQESPYGPEVVLNANEQIIGLYGTKDLGSPDRFY